MAYGRSYKGRRQRVVRKKTRGVTKRVSAVQKLDRLVERAVDRRLKKKALKENRLPQPTILEADRDFDVPSRVVTVGTGMEKNYLRLPLTGGLPEERLAVSAPDSRYRRSKSVFVKGVGISVMLRQTRTVELIAACYPAKVQRYAQPQRSLVMGTPPVGFQVGSTFPWPADDGDEVKAELLTLSETNIVSPHGPFRVRKDDSMGGWKLRAPDKTLFTAMLSEHEGRPVGQCEWDDPLTKRRKKGKIFREEYSCEGLTVTNGQVQTKLRQVEVFITLNKFVKFTKETYAKDEIGEVEFDDPLEIIFGARCPGGINRFPNAAVVDARLEGMTLVLY